MRAGYLSDFFEGIGWKRLSAVETGVDQKHTQHEFNGAESFVRILGKSPRKIKLGQGIPAKLFYFDEQKDDVVQESTELSWYDFRAGQSHRSEEWRLYYKENSVVGTDGYASPGDLLIIAFAKGNASATVIIARKGSTYENQLLWLFGIKESGSLFQVQQQVPRTELDVVNSEILENLGVVVLFKDDSLLQKLLDNFGGKFPSSLEFSRFSRALLPEVKAVDNCDIAIVKWMEQEEVAFRILERHQVESRLKTHFKSVDDFISYSLSVQNRRKSRAGSGFENHLCEVFREHGLSFSWKASIENDAKPDFIFPTLEKYADDAFSVSLKTLLGAKTSCKDRWRQVLAEGTKVKQKHLVTLEPAISSNQIKEMRENQLQLVVPRILHATFNESDRSWLWDLKGFVEAVILKQDQAKIPKFYGEALPGSKKRKSENGLHL